MKPRRKPRHITVKGYKWTEDIKEELLVWRNLGKSIKDMVEILRLRKGYFYNLRPATVRETIRDVMQSKGAIHFTCKSCKAGKRLDLISKEEPCFCYSCFEQIKDFTEFERSIAQSKKQYYKRGSLVR